jgi:hypothetical protein
MSIKFRYALLFIGCIAHAEFLSLSLAHNFWNGTLFILSPIALYRIWWVLIFIWPSWIIVLWKYGLKGNRVLRLLSIVVPIITGLIIMPWLLGYLSFFCSTISGGID